jgi:hypothetical protein
MKRNVKKLSLNRETLHHLNERALHGVKGANNTVVASCQWSDCDTCGIVCSAPIQSCTCPIG